MTPVFPARGAEEFDRLVEGLSTRPVRDTRTSDLLELVGSLRAVEPVAPRPEFSAALRERLMDAADSLLVPDEEVRRLTLPPRAKARDRRIAVLVGAAAMVGASTSLAVAAQSALPGEMLYPLKRVLEDAETGARLSDDARGVSLLGNATDRLGEVTELLRTGDLRQAPAVETTLADFSDQSLEASDLILSDYEESGDTASVEELRDFAATSLQTLAQLETLLPEEARDELQHAAEVLSEIDAAASRVCPSCSGGITQIPPVLLSGGQVSEPGVVETVPGPVVAAEEPSRGGKDGSGGSAGSGGTKDRDGDASGGSVTDPITGGGTTGDDATGPIDDITDAVTGGTDDKNASGGGTTGIDPLDDVLEDVEDGLDDTVDDLLD